MIRHYVITYLIIYNDQASSITRSTITPRVVYAPPSRPIDLRFISFRHPGYPDRCNTLFTFSASDDDRMHHETARLACAVIAGNRWDGALYQDMDGQQRYTGGPNEILRASNYYFHLPGASKQLNNNGLKKTT